MDEHKFHELNKPKITPDSLSVADMFGDRSRFPNIPTDLVRHLKLTITEAKPNRLTYEFLMMPEKVAEGFDQMFIRASKITGLDPSGVLRSTDFEWRDLDPTRVESALAEIRVIFFLDEQGFTEIVPLRSRGRLEADLIADREGIKFAIEVVDSYYYAIKRFSSEQISRWIVSRYQSEEKYAQLAATADRYDCSRWAFITIIDTQPAVALQVHEDFQEAALLAWTEIGTSNLHVCVVTGKEALGYGKDDAVFPEWP